MPSLKRNRINRFSIFHPDQRRTLKEMRWTVIFICINRKNMDNSRFICWYVFLGEGARQNDRLQLFSKSHATEKNMQLYIIVIMQVNKNSIIPTFYGIQIKFEYSQLDICLLSYFLVHYCEQSKNSLTFITSDEHYLANGRWNIVICTSMYIFYQKYKRHMREM